jgi:HK97 family phage portal protein
MNTLNLSAKSHTSRVLTDWAKSRPGAFERMGVQNAVVVSSNLEGMARLFDPLPNPSGFAVNDRSAMQVSTVYACLARLGGAVLQLPIEQYRLDPSGDRKQSPRTALWWLLNETPSAAWTAASWKEWIVRCVALRGDQHTEIVRSRVGSSFGEPIGLKVHHPDYVHARRLAGRLVYDVQDLETMKAYTVDQDDMLHFAGFGFDGLRSLSMIQHAARNAIGSSLAASDYTARSIGEGAMPQIALKYPRAMGKDQTQLLRDSFIATYGTGTGARKLPLVLTEGAEVAPLSISPVDMDLMAARQFDREDICQAMGVHPVIIGDNTKTSSWGTGIEQITLGFVKYTVKPHLRRWEEEMNRKLFRNAGPFLEFDLGALLKGDTKAQAEDDRAALGGPGTGNGYKTVNEIRRARNLAPIEGGDVLFKAEAKAIAPTPEGKTP